MNFRTEIAKNNRDISLSLEMFHFFRLYHIDDIERLRLVVIVNEKIRITIMIFA